VKVFDLARICGSILEAVWRFVDVTVGPLMRAWGFREGEPRMPLGQNFSKRKSCGQQQVDLDQRCATVWFHQARDELEFWGLAKGHAAKRVARVMQKAGDQAALVNLEELAERVGNHPSATAQDPCNGNRLAFGEWPISLSPGRRKQCPVHLLLKPGMSLSTSGTSERQFEPRANPEPYP